MAARDYLTARPYTPAERADKAVLARKLTHSARFTRAVAAIPDAHVEYVLRNNDVASTPARVARLRTMLGLNAWTAAVCARCGAPGTLVPLTPCASCFMRFYCSAACKDAERAAHARVCAKRDAPRDDADPMAPVVVRADTDGGVAAALDSDVAVADVWLAAQAHIVVAAKTKVFNTDVDAMRTVAKAIATTGSMDAAAAWLRTHKSASGAASGATSGAASGAVTCLTDTFE